MKRLTMRKIKEAMRLQASGLSTRKIAASLGVGHSTAMDYMKRIRLAGLTWPLPDEMTDTALEERRWKNGCSTRRVARAVWSRHNRIGLRSTGNCGDLA